MARVLHDHNRQAQARIQACGGHERQRSQAGRSRTGKLGQDSRKECALTAAILLLCCFQALRSVPMCPRYEYCGIKDRKSYAWPEGKRLAVFLALNVEIFAFDDEKSMGLIGAQPAPYVSPHETCRSRFLL